MPQPYRLLPRINSSMAEEWLDIGLAHHLANRYSEAEQAYHKGLRVDPNNGPLLSNLAVMAAQQDRLLNGIQYIERSLIFAPDNPTSWYNHALMLLEAERLDEALISINKSVELMDSGDGLCVKGMILTAAGLAAEAVEAYTKALEKIPDHQMASYNAIFARTLKNTTPEDNFKARQFWHSQFAYKGEKKPHQNDMNPDRPLRIGYIGGDFKMHSASFIWRTVLLNHSKDFEPYVYMTMPFNEELDESTKLFMNKTFWRNVVHLNDQELEERIRQDKIDILIDLAGHTGGNKLTVFTRKPAPIQCHAWGFAHGSGCPEIDYFLACPYSIPQEEREFFAEKIWDLPSIVGFTPPDYGQSGVSESPAVHKGIFTFGVFGRFEKYSPQSIEAWHKILLKTPNSRLYIKDRMTRSLYSVKRILSVMKDIDPKRILFATDCSHTDQLLAYQTVDLVLDTFPHTGGVTALEILYMGVPIITLYNGQVGGRTTSVALKAMGRSGWVAWSIKEYINKAVSLAAERSELSTARSKLRQELLMSPICNGYAEAVETAFRQMWYKHCGLEEKQEKVA